MGEPTIADAVLDRILHRLHRIELTGESLRRTDKGTAAGVGQQRSRNRTKRAGSTSTDDLSDA